ncbi:MAG: glutamine-hydrolyzing GMP synthase [Phycisphaerales bacterium]|nr:glutamine-hydrolyzing GMP synthase [Phycisphaerales bacterium]
MNNPETIAVLDFGGQYTQLIARRVREHSVHSVITGPMVTAEELRALNVAGIILSGGPASVYSDGAPRCRDELFEMNVPILGICYGMQLGCQVLGGDVRSAESREFGRTRLEVTSRDGILAHLPGTTDVWMSHGDIVTSVGGEFVSMARTASCPIAAVRHRTRPFVGVQFHPEVTHTPEGSLIVRNFLFEICGCKGDWRLGDVLEGTIAAIRQRVGPDERVICGLSGGVDSSVTAAMLQRAIGDRLVCVFVDNGLMRLGEVELVETTFRDHFKMELRVARAADRFLSRLDGVADPQEKRRIIGHVFIEVFQEEARRIPNARFLAQGTLYPDVVESGESVGGATAKIKLHHNVGGLPETLGFELIEPLRTLFKDEVRYLGEQLGLPHDLAWRHPFPGPGLAVRIIGPVTCEKLEIVRQADKIVTDEIVAAGWYPKISQAAAVLLPISTVGVMGDERTYQDQYVVAVRFVETTDFMTADWVHADYGMLGRISSRIINEVRQVNRVVYDISSKPPATIEWE